MKKDNYQKLSISSAQLEIPRESYQRDLNTDRVKRIVAEFDERIANEPKVSFRNGHYYVFDGQHTIAARKLRNGGKDLNIMCKVYHDMTEGEEALLFAQQTGASAKLTAGTRIRALAFGGDPEAIAFEKATEDVGLRLDYSQKRGKKRIACVGTAFDEFKALGTARYKEALKIILNAWGGDPESLRREVLIGVTRFVDLYYDEYDPKRLVKRLRMVDPLTIYREGRNTGVNLGGSKKYMYQVYRIYNGGSVKTALPIKF